METTLPNKSYFKLDEVGQLTGVKAYVLRFWETEFDMLKPVSSDSGQKIYTPSDVDMIFKIKKMLFDDKCTIEQAKRNLRLENGDVVTLMDPVIESEPQETLAEEPVIQTQTVEEDEFIEEEKEPELLAEAAEEEILPTLEAQAEEEVPLVQEELVLELEEASLTNNNVMAEPAREIIPSMNLAPTLSATHIAQLQEAQTKLKEILDWAQAVKVRRQWV